MRKAEDKITRANEVETCTNEEETFRETERNCDMTVKQRTERTQREWGEERERERERERKTERERERERETERERERGEAREKERRRQDRTRNKRR